MELEIINTQDCHTTSWEGGTTTQLYIYPEHLGVKDDFSLRISSASVQAGESKFSDFGGYQRFLTILQGSMYLMHGDGEEIKLDVLQPDFFDGAITTYSRATEPVTDFNIIWKNSFMAPEIFITDTTQTVSCAGTAFVYCCSDDGSIDINNVIYKPKRGQLLKVNPTNTHITLNGRMICCLLPSEISE